MKANECFIATIKPLSLVTPISSRALNYAPHSSSARNTLLDSLEAPVQNLSPERGGPD
jgi:hypothetical protein